MESGLTLQIGGWGYFLTYATCTHPHRDVRIAHLLRHVPSEPDREEIPYSPVIVRQQTYLSTTAVCIWLGTIVGSLIISWRATNAFWMCLPLFAVGIAPSAFQRWALWRAKSIHNRRIGSRLNWGSPTLQIGCALILVIAGLFANFLETSHFGFHNAYALYLMTAALLVMSIPIERARAVTDLLTQVRHAIQMRNFERVIELSRSAPKIVARSPELRHNLALATCMTGDRALAISILEDLRKDIPSFKFSWFYLISLHLDDNNPVRAVEIANDTAAYLPTDPGAHLVVARAARRLGDLDLADSAAQRTISLWGESGDVLATIAGIALDRGDSVRANELIERAMKLAPDDTYVLLVRAQVWLQTKPFEIAREAAEKVIAIIRKEPLEGFAHEVSLLEKAIVAP